MAYILLDVNIPVTVMPAIRTSWATTISGTGPPTHRGTNNCPQAQNTSASTAAAEKR